MIDSTTPNLNSTESYYTAPTSNQVASPFIPVLTQNPREFFQRYGLRLFLGLIVIVGSLYVLKNTLSPAPIRSVTIVGVGTKRVAADKVSLILTFIAGGTNRSEALANGDAEYQKIMAIIQEFNPSETNKAPYQLVPRDASGSVANALSGGYQYVSGAQVSFEDQSRINDLITILNNEEVNVAQIQYMTKDETKVSEEVRKLAVIDAREKAEQIAQASGVRVGKILSIAEQQSNAETGNTVTVSAAKTEDQIPSEFNDVEIQVVVTASFELK